MKIIANAPEGYITSLTFNEVKALLSVNDNRKTDLTKNIRVGDELTFTVALANLNLLKDVRIEGSYEALGELKKAANMLQKSIDIIDNAGGHLTIIQDKIKNQQA